MDVSFQLLDGKYADWAILRSWEEWNQVHPQEDFLHLRQTLLHTPWAKDHWRLLGLFVDQQPIACMSLYELDFTLQQQPIKIGGIGSFVVLKTHRQKGLGRLMLEKAHDLFREQGYTFSLLYSGVNPGYYEKSGYRLLPSHAYTAPFPLSPPADLETTLKFRPFERQDLDSLIGLYPTPLQHQTLWRNRLASEWTHRCTRIQSTEQIFGPQHVSDFTVAETLTGVTPQITAYLRHYTGEKDGISTLSLLEYGHAPNQENDLARLLHALPQHLTTPCTRLKGRLPKSFQRLFPETTFSTVPATGMPLMLCPLHINHPLPSFKDADEYFVWDTDGF